MSRTASLSLLLSCEHGGNYLPARYRHCFDSDAARAALASHRGWDRGSLMIARWLQRAFDAPLVSSRTSRLLIELNRSTGHQRIFSDWSRQLPDEQRRLLLDRYYHPYREQVIQQAAAAMTSGRCVLHVSVHTFTPLWNGAVRKTDVGLLFDPRRQREAAFCQRWQAQLRQQLPDLVMHRNQPYRGTSDGLTTALRSRFSPAQYLGVELEVNQRFFAAPMSSACRRRLLKELVCSLEEALAAD